MKLRKAAFALVFAFAALAAHGKTVKMEVNGMVCAFCAQGIEKKLRAMSPTRDVLVSLERHVVAIALKDGQDIPDATLTASLKDAGYDVTSIARVDESLDAIRKAIKAK